MNGWNEKTQSIYLQFAQNASRHTGTRRKTDMGRFICPNCGGQMTERDESNKFHPEIEIIFCNCVDKCGVESVKIVKKRDEFVN